MIKELKKLAMEHELKKYPDNPYPCIRKYTDKTANGLTKCIIDYVRFIGGQAERINTMGRPIDNRREVVDVIGRRRVIGSITWIPSTSTKGSADISITYKGRSIKVEVKVGADRQSEAQKKYQRSVESAGGVYFIARDFKSFYEFIHSL